jgi:protein-L-isoaspartate(D-aspartate) O-methyltransferase
VVSIEINKKTFEFAKKNLVSTGYEDIIIIHGDGARGYEEKSPYDAISITASSPEIPNPLKEQLASPGKIIAPLCNSNYFGQDLVLLEKNEFGKVSERTIMKVQYVPLVSDEARK